MFFITAAAVGNAILIIHAAHHVFYCPGLPRDHQAPNPTQTRSPWAIKTLLTVPGKARGLHQNNRRHVRPPFTLGLEFAGVVVSAPPSSALRPGARVFGAGAGAYAQYVSVPVAAHRHTLHAVPDAGWTFAHAASLGATLPVAYGALRLRAGLRRGETVLVHAAAGGLGLAAVQLCAALGCRVIGTAGSAAKCRVAERFGAARCINYAENPRWWDDVRALTPAERGEERGRGVDVVFDPVGLVDDSLRCLSDRGRILIVGFAGREGDMEAVKMNRVLLKQATVIGYVSGHPVGSSYSPSMRLYRLR